MDLSSSLETEGSCKLPSPRFYSCIWVPLVPSLRLHGGRQPSRKQTRGTVPPATASYPCPLGRAPPSQAGSFLKWPSHPSWRRQSRAKTHGEAGIVWVRQLLGRSRQRGCKWLAVGRAPRSNSRMHPLPRCWGGWSGPELAGARVSRSPPPPPSFLPTPEPLGVVFWKYFQALQQYPARSLPSPGSGCPCGEGTCSQSS